MPTPPFVLPFHEAPVRGWLHQPEQPNGLALALTHGASGNAQSPLLVKIATACAEAGLLVLRFDLPYRQQRASGPPSHSGTADRENIRIAVSLLRDRVGKGKVLMGGHSYGGRMTTMLAAENSTAADGLVLLSYPLHPPGTTTMRTQHFPAILNPALFVQGEQDPFGGPEEIREAIKTIPARTTVSAIVRAGHDLKRGEFDLASFVVSPIAQLLSP